MEIGQENAGMHGHDCFELTYITGGTAIHTLNGVRGRLQAGDYFIVDYGSRHSYEECQNVTLINCMFTPELIDSSLTGCRSFEETLRFCLIRYYKKYYGQRISDHILHDEDGQVLKSLREIAEENKSKEMGYLQILRFRLIEIIILTLRKMIKESNADESGEAKSDVIMKLIRYIDVNFRNRAVLTHFCQENYFSQQYISSRFKVEKGITLLEYLQKIRIKKSCELLLGSNMTVKEIAAEVGYEDIQFFGQVFRRFLHMTPGRYRKTVRPSDTD